MTNLFILIDSICCRENQISKFKGNVLNLGSNHQLNGPLRMGPAISNKALFRLITLLISDTWTIIVEIPSYSGFHPQRSKLEFHFPAFCLKKIKNISGENAHSKQIVILNWVTSFKRDFLMHYELCLLVCWLIYPVIISKEVMMA